MANDGKPKNANTSPDTGALRRALGTFLTGVTVVTCADALGRPRGITANSFTSVSLDPPLVLVCVARSAGSHGAFTAAEGFGVNILAGDQKAVSQLFASRSPRKFAAVSWTPGVTGAPRLSRVLAWFDCETRQRIDAGDHVVLIGKVAAFSAAGGPPLGYCRGSYVSFGPGRPRDGESDRHQAWSAPAARTMPSSSE